TRETIKSQGGKYDYLLLNLQHEGIAFRTLREFFEKPEYSDSEFSLRAWYHDAKAAEWKNSNELKKQYKHASIVGDGRVVFNIKGNAYRLVVAIDYEF